MQTFKDLKKQILSDKEIKNHYANMESEYKVIAQVVEARMKNGITQSELAKKIGTKQSAISRFESGNYNPSLEFLNKLAKALDTKLCISFE